MQKLKKRNTYTPTNVSQVRGNCDPSLKVSGRRNGVSDLKTFSNNPDATITAGEQAGKNLRVLNKRGEPLMPCSPAKAKKILKSGNAKVVRRTPFVIQLNYACGETKHEVKLGFDSGYQHVGLCAVSNELKRELFSAEAFMNLVRWKIIEKLKNEFTDITTTNTFGYITKHNRKQIKLEKSHINDAFVIANGKEERRCNGFYLFQIRRSNRKLHKGSRSHIKNQCPRFVDGFRLFDKVLYKNEEVFICSRRQSKGGFTLKTFNGNTIHHVNSKKIKLLETSNAFRIIPIEVKKPV